MAKPIGRTAVGRRVPASGAGPTMAWRRLDCPGQDRCRLTGFGAWWRMTGLAVLGWRRLEYQVTCGAAWRTVAACVSGRIGGADVRLEVAVDESGSWTVNGLACDALSGCSDLDLGFTPATNLIPIRRLCLPIGATGSSRSAWLPEATARPEVLEQTYRRTAHDRYDYAAARLGVRAELTVNDDGFVTDYPGLWAATGHDDPP